MNKFKTAIILVDMQDFFLKNFVPAVRKKLIYNQQQFIDKCVKNKLPFVVLEYKCRGIFRGHTIPILLNRIKPSLKGTIIKERNGGFTDTNLDDILKELGAKEVVLMGVNANGCIQDTAIGAIHRGYKVITSYGIIASSYRKDMELTKRNKKWFEKNTSFYKNHEDLINYLSSRI